MTLLVVFLLACAAVYVGTVDAAFAALMRLSLRLDAERHDWLDRLGYLNDPVQLFVPIRLLEGLIIILVVAVTMLETDARGFASVATVTVGLILFLLLCGHLLPLLIARRDPVRVLELLLPSLQLVVGGLRPISRPLIGLLQGGRSHGEVAVNGNRTIADNTGSVTAIDDAATSLSDRAALEEQEEHAMLQSVVDFGDTLVREVMTPRPDIVAVPSDATLEQLRKIFSEEQYSRLPVFKQSLDAVIGFVFVKDLVTLVNVPGSTHVVGQLMRPAHIVPETKRVADLLRELQREHVQSAIVHDEYGGTAGLVTIEDLLEEIVGEIRDEYDVEAEPIVDEGAGSFVFDGRVNIDNLSKRLNIVIKPQGFETVAGYILARLGRVPQVGESFEIDELYVDVLEAERRRLHRIRLRRRRKAGADLSG